MNPKPSTLPHRFALLLTLTALVLPTACARRETRTLEATAYCGCGQCCSWHRGRWLYLKLNFWNRYWSAGAQKGEPYTGHTASGTKPKQPDAGLFAFRTLVHPWEIPFRIVFFPWLLLPQKGTIAADTRYYPFGTVMEVPGYGKGVVRDRGGAIKGPDRIDLYFRSHQRALEWGRKRVEVEITYPD